MIKYNFQINKNVCFAYWAQSMTEWNWYFNRPEYEYYKSICGEFDELEKTALQRLREILRKPDNAYQWLWSRYAGMPIENKKESEDWRKIKEVLSGRFELIWSEEHSKLLYWLKALKEYKFNKLNPFFKRTEIFYGVDFKEEITVQLSFGYNNLFPGGHVKKGFENLMLLNISNLNENYALKAISALTHETIHLIDYSSSKSALLKESYLKIIKPLGITRKKPSWYYLMTESVITAIAGANFSYIDSKMSLREEVDKSKNTLGRKLACEENDYSRQIKIVAKCLKPATEEYFENKKEMDEPYADKVAQTWVDLRKKQDREVGE